MTDEGPILHADLDSFYASVEQRDDPALKGRPVIVGGGVVLAASYEAKAYGVRTAMGGTQARRLCPHAVVVPPRMSAYMAASRLVFDVFRDTTPWVEGISVDEAFLDVGGLGRIAGRPSQIAERLRAAVAERAGLPITVGVARTKFLAKVASRVAKPDGLLVVPHDGELEFLHPLPVSALWGVGKITAEKLRVRGITTVGQLAASEQVDLVGLLGRVAGAHLHDLARNEDPRRVELGVRRRSIGAQRALGRGRRTPAELDVVLVALIDRIARRLRAARRICRTVTIRLRFADFSRATRSHTLTDPTAGTGVLLAAARDLLVAALPLIADRGLTMLGASLSNLADENPFQPTLPFERERATELDTALDAVRDRFGKTAVTRAVLLGRPDDLEVPMLPD
ncbi:DNA polymerase IV [Amycolatopsis vancoresmycina]|nr:DNA polymerase IV [Amycolatopsis vancoresmycina]